MPSWQARCTKVALALKMRRRHWGDEQALARRARRVFGAPAPMQWLRTRDVGIASVRDGAVHGEWVTAAGSDRGTILYLHGGGYVGGSPASHRPITAALARLGRRRVFSLDYRRAPEHRFPAAADDTLAAYRWLLAQGIAPGSLALAGDSAGGGLALSTLLRVRDERLPPPACAVCFSPWTDLTGSGESVRANDGRCAVLRPENMAAFAHTYLGAASPTDPYASPLFADLGGLPPILLQVASTELLLDDARRVDDKLRRAGGTSRLEIYADMFHVWQMLDGFVPESRLALQRAAAFLNDTAGGA
ncbi:MAG TPA: alpha/beta hydrolase [Methylomirabilota bacterium]|jgi:acetyl esterase/lipase|nr:alpha/beta hydrolase [Methylomirabilota bacterium]